MFVNRGYLISVPILGDCESFIDSWILALLSMIMGVFSMQIQHSEGES